MSCTRPRLPVHTVLSACLLLLFATRNAQSRPASAEDIFAGTNVFRFEIEISPQGMKKLGANGGGGDQKRPVANATIKEGGVVYTNVALHLKGAAGSFRPVEDDPALTLNFDKFAPGQAFHGLHKISLNNSVQDPSFLSEKVCRELFAASGVPVPRAGFAKVSLNGRDLGIHVLIEGYNKQFLKRFYQNVGGNLYDGGFVKDITETLEVNSGDTPAEHPGKKALAEAAIEPDPVKRWARLGQTLDIDHFLSFMAMEVIVCHWDGYSANRNNYRIFHDLGSNKMVFFPHGMDQMFGVERAGPDYPILPQMEGMVAQAVISTPEGHRLYLERVAQLCTNVFKVDPILRRVDGWAAVLHSAIAESDPQAARDFDQQVGALKTRIKQRDRSLKSQLGSLANAPKFSAEGVMPLAADWGARPQMGRPEFSEDPAPGGGSWLHIKSTDAGDLGSWRTSVRLEPGSYRFEGKILTKGVAPRGGQGGAGLRISGGETARELAGTADWRKFEYAFQSPGAEVVLVCELRASRGEAWFDTASLRIVRVPAQ